MIDFDTLPISGKTDTIRQAIQQGNHHLELILNDYLNSFLSSLSAYRIDWQTLNQQNFVDIIYESIEQIECLKKDFVDMLGVIAKSQTVCRGEVFVEFFERLLQYYQDNGITLYTSNEMHIIANDNYRYLNQSLLISFAAVMIDNLRFDVLAEVVNSRFLITNKNRVGGLDDVNYIRFREYNYTLNEYMQKQKSSNYYSYTAFVMRSMNSEADFSKMIESDILLFYLSLLYPGDQFFDRMWFPELAAFNHKAQVLPKLVSKKYFEKAKVLFAVETAADFKQKMISIAAISNQHSVYGVPALVDALNVGQVATIA